MKLTAEQISAVKDRLKDTTDGDYIHIYPCGSMDLDGEFSLDDLETIIREVRREAGEEKV